MAQQNRHIDKALEHIGKETARIDGSDTSRRWQIARARHLGATWEQIAEQLQTPSNEYAYSAQAAHKKYRYLVYDAITKRVHNHKTGWTYDPETKQSWSEKQLPL